MSEKLLQHLSSIKAPFGGEKVFKDECAFSFDNPESETGLYVCMNTFIGIGKKYLEAYHQKTGNCVFFHLRRRRKLIPQPADPPPEQAPTKIAIGVEGGFNVDQKKFEFEDTNSIVILPEWTTIPLPDTSIPDLVQLSAAGILAAEDAWKQEEAAAMAGTWEGEKLRVSKHAENLKQLDNGKKIPPAGWKCEICDLTSNLWLNLTDGSILCGRKFFDGTGGNNHAIDHFKQVSHPLAVKLGTITPDGADVFSYDEDDMVEDPHLKKHLSHFGINIHTLEKTDKTMVELEIDINQRIGEWDVIQEAGCDLKPMYGQGYTGMRNLGNSCYMNSLMQVLFSIPDFQQKYCNHYTNILQSVNSDPTSSFDLQMGKLGSGLLSGEYSKPSAEESTDYQSSPTGIRPQMFKSLIGRGHPEFSTKRQQDVQEFFLHIVNLLERNCRGSSNPTDCFKYQVEERVECVQSRKVRYSQRDDFLLSLPVPLEAATNKEQVEAYEQKKKELESREERINPKEIVRPRIGLSSCIEAFASPVTVDDFYSSALKAKGLAKNTTRLSTFPDYLLIHLKKFTISADWTPKKLDVSMDMPDDLDITHLRGTGMQPGEETLPDEPQESAEPAINIDESIVNQVADMGFPIEACRKGVYYTNNVGLEAACDWVMQHMDDSDFSAPLQLPGKKSSGGFVPNEEAIAMIIVMGFTRDNAIRALKETDNNLERAADWIFSHSAELDAPMETESAEPAPSQSSYREGSGKYKLVAFISHMGTSTNCGHYVCHILKEGQWVIYNDEKVALSERPPKDLAYVYLYKRK